LVLENWFYPIAWYNGVGGHAYTYVTVIYDLIRNPKLLDGKAYWPSVNIMSPIDVIANFNNCTIKNSNNEPYWLWSDVDVPQGKVVLTTVHKWNGKTGQECAYPEMIQPGLVPKN
jgi:hypothetical protein